MTTYQNDDYAKVYQRPMPICESAELPIYKTENETYLIYEDKETINSGEIKTNAIRFSSWTEFLKQDLEFQALSKESPYIYTIYMSKKDPRFFKTTERTILNQKQSTLKIYFYRIIK